jgi:hypothetical protein
MTHRRLPHLSAGWVAVLVACLMVGFSVPPLVNSAQEAPNKDYNLWQDTGRLAAAGGEVYPRDGSEFPFMYPPPCATLLALGAPLGEFAFVLALVLLNSAAWAACILLSVHLAAGRWRGVHPGLFFWPSAAVLPLVYNTYLLGQPALLLLALVLGCFALLRGGRGFAAGLLLAVAVAIKAYPLIVAGYLLYRRQWRALAGLSAGLALLFLVLPLAFRPPAQAAEDLSVWARGMLFRHGEEGMAQRPLRSHSFKNQSLPATVHRLTRPVPADGEADPSWKVNLVSLTFGQANALMAAASLALVGFYVFATAGRRGPPEAVALDQGMAVMLAVFLAPLSFQYSYVWMLFPFTALLHLAAESAPGSGLRRAAVWGMAVPVALLAFSIPFTREAAAFGNIFFAGVALFLALGLLLRSGLLNRAWTADRGRVAGGAT